MLNHLVTARHVKTCGILFSLFVLCVASVQTDRYYDEYYNNRDRVLELSYHGLIKENETFVEITPLIKVDETKICDFHIINKGKKEIPFQIELVNNLGILRTKKSLNCEKRKNYKFEIAAVFCDGSYSKSANVHISVIDINEYSPTFLQPSYVVEVDEGRLYQEIIRVEATDKDCTPLFGDVCKYEILTKDQPFTIDNEGSIRNTDPLSHKVSHNHIFSVVAYDCAMKQSAPVMVNVKVRRVCEMRIVGIPERIDYPAHSSESTYLFPKLHLELCDMDCHNKNMVIESSVSLKTKHISFGCDRDASKCAQDDVIDLLPKETEWTKNLIFDEGPESIFHFDGTSGAIVPKSVVPHPDFASQSFSISTMFRHRSRQTTDKHIKEHIICSADDHKMNRHHMALFVRNCRLIFLLRKNFNEGDLNMFSPAEWRWKLPQVCDNDWHSYTVNVDLPKVDLYVDGEKFTPTAEDKHSNPEVIDDWPLHAAHGINATLTVGACYQGSENLLKHGFSGDISSIHFSPSKLMTHEQVVCGLKCAEHLIVPPVHLLQPTQQMRANVQLNEINVKGSVKADIESLLQSIQYVNTKSNPTIGRRNIELQTTVSCPNKKAIRLPTIESYIMVTESMVSATKEPSSSVASNRVSDKPLTEQQKPQIVITGNANHLISYPDIKQGVRIWANISISVFSEGHMKPLLQKLDSCSVTVFPSLNPDHEEISIDGDESISSTLDIKTNINKDGVEMTGYDTISNYLQVLKSLVYTNKKPAYYLNRVFKLSCAQVNFHFRSTEFTLTLTVLHPKQTPTMAPVAQKDHDSNMFAYAMIHSHEIQEPASRVSNVIQKTQSSHSTMLIVVICASFILLICGVGIARLRNSSVRNIEKHQPCPKVASDQQLDWDDSALTITINPMQNGNVSDESSDSDNSDSEDEEATNGRYKNVSQLEWDNSTM